MSKPTLYVLAGVNGAGKSSVGGMVLKLLGLQWYNPDTLARELMRELGMSQQDANIEAWTEGMRQLDAAVDKQKPFAFETTLGGNTVCRKIRAASNTHKIRIWYCGLNSPGMHMERIRLRVLNGGHDIPKEKVFERWKASRSNLIELIPLLTELSVFDNSTTVGAGEPVPNPKNILHLRNGKILHPRTIEALASTPEWAQAIVEGVLQLSHGQKP